MATIRIANSNNLELIVATFIVFILLLIFRIISGFSGLYGQDAYEYTRYASRIYLFFETGLHPGDYFWPLFYPISGAILNFVIGDIAFSLQLVSIIAYCCSFFMLNKLIRYIHEDSKYKILIFTGLFFLLSPIVIRSSLISMSDMLAMSFILTTIYFSLRYYYSFSPISLYAAIFFCGAAIMTRYPAALVLLFPMILILKKFLHFITLRSLCTIIIIIILVLIPHFLIRWSDPSVFVTHEFVQNWSILNFFSNEMANNSGHFKYPLFNLAYSFFTFYHPGYIFLGLFIILFIRHNDILKPVRLYILLSILIYTLFIAGLPYQNIRYLLLIFPLVLVMIYPAFTRFIAFLQRMRISIKAIFITIIIIQLALSYRAFLPFYRLNKLERSIAEHLSKYSNNTIVSFGMDVSLQYYLKEKNIINFMNLDQNDDLEDAILLIDERSFLTQYRSTEWTDKWVQFKEHNHLKELAKFNNNWVLYKIQ